MLLEIQKDAASESGNETIGTTPVRLLAVRFVNAPALPINVPFKITPVELLVRMVAGNCANGTVPTILVAKTELALPA